MNHHQGWEDDISDVKSMMDVQKLYKTLGKSIYREKIGCLISKSVFVFTSIKFEKYELKGSAFLFIKCSKKIIHVQNMLL